MKRLVNFFQVKNSLLNKLEQEYKSLQLRSENKKKI